MAKAECVLCLRGEGRKELDGLLYVLVINLLVCQGSFLIC